MSSKDKPAAPLVPTEIRIRRGTRALGLVFNDGTSADLPAEYLRVESPSAEVRGHSPDQKVLVTGREAVNIVAVEPVGNYAIRIRFTDGHDTGIFSWLYLKQLSVEQEQRWQAYLTQLAKRGIARRT